MSGWCDYIQSHGPGCARVVFTDTPLAACASFGTVTTLVDFFIADDVHGVAKASYLIYEMVLLHSASGGQMYDLKLLAVWLFGCFADAQTEAVPPGPKGR